MDKANEGSVERGGRGSAKGKDEASTARGDWVQIHSILLSPEERSSKVPEDTEAVPLEMWVKGFLLDQRAELGDEVEIETVIGRRLRGTLSSVSPGYTHTFGKTLPALLHVGAQLRDIMGEIGAGKEAVDG